MKRKIVLSIATSLILSQSVYAKEISKKLDHITVTAQKTEESIQDVPIAISVFDEFTLEDRNIDSLADISKYTPGLELIGQGSSDKYTPSMRGMFADHAAGGPVAGLYVDGIPITGGAGYDETLLDIERVEVLKGPQGTLYGKNSEVGVLNIITKKPNNETKVNLGGKVGSDNLHQYTLNVSGPIQRDKLYIGISGKHYEKDGYVKNYNTGEIVDDREHNYGKVNLRYTPNDDLEFSLISSLIKYDDGAQRGGLTSNKPREVGNDIDGYHRSTILENALNINYTINDKLNVTSTTAYRDFNEKNGNDWDYAGDYSKRFHSWRDTTYKTLSEELRFNYETDTIKLVSGIFLEKSNTDYKRTDDKWWLPSIVEITHDVKGNTKGIFSHLTYDINDKFALIGGLRFDNEQKTYKDLTQTIKYDEDEISPKIGFTYDMTKEMMTYLTISKGYRSGGFNDAAPAGYSKSYEKESLYSYEVGLKGTTLGNRLNFDMAIYYMDISDMQVDEYVGVSNPITTNAAEATSKGIEASINYQVTDAINLYAGASYNDIQFDKYNDGNNDYSGNRTTFSPKYDFHLGTSYRAENGFYARADINGYGDMYLDSANNNKRDAYVLVNTKVGYEQEDYDIYLYANNLFDKEYHADGHFNGTYSYYSDPREIGLQLAYRF